MMQSKENKDPKTLQRPFATPSIVPGPQRVQVNRTTGITGPGRAAVTTAAVKKFTLIDFEIGRPLAEMRTI